MLIRRAIRKLMGRRRKPKVFVIGLNHTGTTSMGSYLVNAGLLLAPQRTFERMRPDYDAGNWDKLAHEIDKYDAFQDSPFSSVSVPFLDFLQKRYPESKFILTRRGTAAEWQATMERLHRKNWYGDVDVITWKHVKEVNYVHETFIYDALMRVVKSEAYPPYDPGIWMNRYDRYNHMVRNHFHGAPNFLEINLADSGSEVTLQSFLGWKELLPIPHLNSSKPTEA